MVSLPPVGAASSPATGCGRFDGVDLARLASQMQTPCQVYSASAIRSRIRDLQLALRGMDAQVCFAVKANPLRAILQRRKSAALWRA